VLDGFTITAGNADGSGSDGYGGAVSNYQSNPTIKNCTFTTNTATKRGGAVFNKQSGPLVTNCIFSGNSAVNAGGA
jgi:predicted outer membrane repeat protein